MDLFTVIGDQNRRRILEMLASSGQLSMSDISDKFSISPPAISQHLKVLRDAKLVQVKKRAQKRIYGLNPKAKNWIKKIMLLWNQRFDKLEVRLWEK